MKYDVIIIGGGPAGMTAAVYTARKKLKTLLITRDIGGQAAQSYEVDNYLGLAMVSGPILVQKFEDHIEKYQDKIELRLVVAGVGGIKKINGGFEVQSNKHSDQAKAVIIASGKKPLLLNVPGEQEFLNRGVTYCSWCDGPIFSGRDVAIIGGGNSAADTAINLSGVVRQIYLLNNTDKLSADQVLIDRLTELTNVRIINQAQLKAIEGDDVVKSISFTDLSSGLDKDISLSGVFIEAGSVPADEFVEGIVKLNSQHEIIIDKQNMTSVAGIFAAGDVTDVIDKQIIIAAGEGAKAGIAVARYLSRN